MTSTQSEYSEDMGSTPRGCLHVNYFFKCNLHNDLPAIQGAHNEIMCVIASHNSGPSSAQSLTEENCGENFSEGSIEEVPFYNLLHTFRHFIK